MIDINTDKIVKSVICSKDETKYEKVECCYNYYLDKKKGMMYMIMMPIYYNDKTSRRSEYAIKIAEIEPEKSHNSYKIILSMGPYLYETIEDKQQVKLNTIFKLNISFGNALILYNMLLTLSYAVIYVDNIFYSNLNLFGKELFLHDQEVLVKIYDRHVELKDIRYNRWITFEHWIRDLAFRPAIKRYENVLICYWQHEQGYYDELILYAVIIFTEGNMVKYVKL